MIMSTPKEKIFSLISSQSLIGISHALSILILLAPVKTLAFTVVDLEGRAFRRADRQAQWHPLAVGDTLEATDLIRPELGSSVKIQCPNGQLRLVTPTGEESRVRNNCPGPQPIVIRPVEVAAGDLRGGSDPNIPYIITPRDGLLLDARPSLRWNSVVEATSYTVRLLRGTREVWQLETTQNAISYPDDQAALEPYANYSLVVTSNKNRSSAEETFANFTFKVLALEESFLIQEAVEQIQQSSLSEQSRLLALGNLYASENLVSEAINTLETLVNVGTQVPAVYRMLGDLYQQAGLRLLAEERYQQAIEYAVDSSEQLQRAASELGLGLLYVRIEDIPKARDHLNNAKELYSNQGYEDMLTLIDQELERLNF